MAKKPIEVQKTHSTVRIEATGNHEFALSIDTGEKFAVINMSFIDLLQMRDGINEVLKKDLEIMP